VVKERERWFGVVMGETPDSGEWTSEKRLFSLIRGCREALM